MKGKSLEMHDNSCEMQQRYRLRDRLSAEKGGQAVDKCIGDKKYGGRPCGGPRKQDEDRDAEAVS